ncbi:non-canonical purine NTP pyrophosphatase, partial [Lysinibacillus sp. D4B1_S16]|uniref:non-canonical purine NTP pyrophosphatase n=1 Tax=Lysinibacillus sp. D4B1_S16 TaxID=2941231 RepID=UPI0024BEA0A8
GTNGFGYDPIFFVPSLDRMMAELTPEEIGAISHRGNAIRKLKEQLPNLIKEEVVFMKILIMSALHGDCQ